MTYLADTNVALRLILPSDPQHVVVSSAVSRLRQHGEVIFNTAQVLIEFQALATRPTLANGLGMAAAEASLEAKKLEVIFPLLPETPAIYPKWRILADAHGVIGRQVFDARLVAVMQAHGVSHILTMNSTHFQRFSGITIVEPAHVS